MHYTLKQNPEHEKILRQYGFHYMNEYTWGNHLKNARKMFPDSKLGNEELMYEYLEHITKVEKEKKSQSVVDLEEKGKKEKQILDKYGAKGSFYHFVIAAHRHGFSTGDPLEDVECYLKSCQETQERIDEEKRQEMLKRKNFLLSLGLDGSWYNYRNLAHKSGFVFDDDFKSIKAYVMSLKQKKEAENAKRDEICERHRDFLQSLGYEYLSEYTWGRLLSLAKRNGFDHQEIGPEEAIKRYHLLKKSMSDDAMKEQEEHDSFLSSHGHAGADWHNTLVAARKCGFDTGDDYQDILLHWQRLDSEEKRLNDEAIQMALQHAQLMERYELKYTNEQSFSRTCNIALKMFPDDSDEIALEKYLLLLSERKKYGSLMKKKQMQELGFDNLEDFQRYVLERRKQKELEHKKKQAKIVEHLHFLQENIEVLEANGQKMNIRYDGFLLETEVDLYMVPGVAFLHGRNIETGQYECLTGGETKNLRQHIQYFVRMSDKFRVKPYEKDNRWYEIAHDYEHFQIVILKDFPHSDRKKDREDVELMYALKNNAKFWKPVGGRQKMLANMLLKS